MKKVVLVYILFFVFITMIFMTAIHGIDNAYNLLIVEKETGVKFFDSNIFGHVIEGHTLYNSSVYLLFISYLSLLASFLFFIFIIITEYEKKGGKK